MAQPRNSKLHQPANPTDHSSNPPTTSHERRFSNRRPLAQLERIDARFHTRTSHRPTHTGKPIGCLHRRSPTPKVPPPTVGAQRLPVMTQDMPPKGGYEPIQYKRNLPAKGFRPGVLLLGMGAVMGFGWYKLIHGIREANELAREKMWARIHLIPLLQAEEDRDQVRRYWADQAREKELLGENRKVYNKEQFVRPTLALAPGRTN
ncbi:hypothetical protein NLU13_6697 [Sarocladium strictum]|uniref:NADH dehydrogenase [ubiquinone] 1 alpha subcomplex subunit 13 n=1 Tax=Sarocladium strictum TaxID=5046 RepID=A0AA39L640_SARSR|nr:hypothetical protein NLU13_6697 [Sarocladium strictum]